MDGVESVWSRFKWKDCSNLPFFIEVYQRWSQSGQNYLTPVATIFTFLLFYQNFLNVLHIFKEKNIWVERRRTVKTLFPSEDNIGN